MVRKRRYKARVVLLEKLMNDLKKLGGKIIASKMAMGSMGIRKEELTMEWIY
jgi:peroxiredoxin family protein